MHLTVIGSFGFSDPDPAATLRVWAQRVGVRAVQAYRNPERSPTPSQMLHAARSAGLTFDSLHGVFGPELDPSHLDESSRRLSVEVYESEAELVKRLGGDMVVVHPSPAMPGHDGRDHAHRLGQLSRSIDELSEIGQSLDVTFLIENQPPYHPVGQTRDLVHLIRSSRQKAIGFCFDVAHAHMCGDEVADLRAVDSLLRLVHASDNHGQLDEHELCFDGTVDWRGVGAALQEMRFDGPFMFEVFFNAEQLQSKLTDGWLDRLHRVLGLGPVAPRQAAK